jgi:sterol O-acyltransferase
MPLILMIMLMVFLLFESFPNALAELTLFADREFYQDWWNATSIEEFYAKWLKFSYLFYYRHVYMKLLSRFSPNSAKAITNLVSAGMQELIMVSIFNLNALQIMSFGVYGMHLFKAQCVATLWSVI